MFLVIKRKQKLPEQMLLDQEIMYFSRKRLFRLEKMKLWENLIAAFQCLKGSKRVGEGFRKRAWMNSMRGSGFRL